MLLKSRRIRLYLKWLYHKTDINHLNPAPSKVRGSVDFSMKQTFMKAAASAFAGIVLAATLLPAQAKSVAPDTSQILLNAVNTALIQASVPPDAGNTAE